MKRYGASMHEKSAISRLKARRCDNQDQKCGRDGRQSVCVYTCIHVSNRLSRDPISPSPPSRGARLRFVTVHAGAPDQLFVQVGWKVEPASWSSSRRTTAPRDASHPHRLTPTPRPAPPLRPASIRAPYTPFLSALPEVGHRHRMAVLHC